MPKGWATKSCRQCGDVFHGLSARLYCGDRCRIIAGAKVDPDSGCWVWQKKINTNGRAVVAIDGHTEQMAMRVAYAAFVGPIPAGKFVCHTCDDPRCVNPHHGFLGTQQDNMNDMKQKQRQARGAANAKAKLTDEQVRAIRAASDKNKDIAKRFGVSAAMVGYIKRGMNWKHVA